MHDFNKLVSYFIETDSLIFTDDPFKVRLTANVELVRGLCDGDLLTWVILTKDRRAQFVLGKEISERITKIVREAREKKQRLTDAKEADQLLSQIMMDLSGSNSLYKRIKLKLACRKK